MVTEGSCEAASQLLLRVQATHHHRQSLQPAQATTPITVLPPLLFLLPLTLPWAPWPPAVLRDARHPPSSRPALVSWGCRNDVPHTGRQKRHTSVVSQWTRLQARDQVVCTVGSFSGSEGESVPGLSPSVWWLPTIPCIPWREDTSRHCLLLSHVVQPCLSSLKVPVSTFPTFKRTPITGSRPTLILYSLVVTACVFTLFLDEDVSDMTFGGYNTEPRVHACTTCILSSIQVPTSSVNGDHSSFAFLVFPTTYTFMSLNIHTYFGLYMSISEYMYHLHIHFPFTPSLYYIFQGTVKGP